MKTLFPAIVRVMALVSCLLVVSCAAGAGPGAVTPSIGQTCGEGLHACNVISGYGGNFSAPNRLGATIAGGGQRGEPNQVTGDFGTVSGGEDNVAGEGSVVGGGAHNTAINFHAVVGGGTENLASAQEATVAGGYNNTANQRFATVGGGAANVASHMNATVAGGSSNLAAFTFAAVCGGTRNAATSTAAVVAGGENNHADGTFSAVLGGLNNSAQGYLATVGGGAGNTAGGRYAAVLGGFANSAAADYSLAFGLKAAVRPSDAGTVLFADSTGPAFSSETPNEFAVRATGGARFVTAVDVAGRPLAGVRLSPGGGAWETLSDYNSKSGFRPANGQEILERLMRLPLMTWSYRTEDPSVRHIGPTAQDFAAAFALGGDARYISTVDADGVALAAIQQLYRILLNSKRLDSTQRMESLERSLAFSNALALSSLVVAVVALRQGHSGVLKHRRARRGHAAR